MYWNGFVWITANLLNLSCASLCAIFPESGAQGQRCARYKHYYHQVSFAIVPSFADFSHTFFSQHNSASSFLLKTLKVRFKNNFDFFYLSNIKAVNLLEAKLRM